MWAEDWRRAGTRGVWRGGALCMGMPCSSVVGGGALFTPRVRAASQRVLLLVGLHVFLERGVVSHAGGLSRGPSSPYVRVTKPMMGFGVT